METAIYLRYRLRYTRAFVTTNDGHSARTDIGNTLFFATIFWFKKGLIFIPPLPILLNYVVCQWRNPAPVQFHTQNIA